MCVVVPTFFKKTNKYMEECKITFPDVEQDVGLSPSKIPIVITFNGIHHYVGTEPITANFKTKVNELLFHLGTSRSLAFLLSNFTEDQEVKASLSGLAEQISKQQYIFFNLFKPKQDIKNKKIKYGNTKGDLHVREFKIDTTTFSDLQCNCGIIFQSKAEKKEHKKEVHKNKEWKCSKCSTVCGLGKTLKRHYLSKHCEYWKFKCLYCEFGRNEKYLVQSHMVKDHTKVCTYPCRKPVCAHKPRRTFPTEVHRDRHERYCGAPKDILCQYCEKGFKRKKNMVTHLKDTHRISEDGYYCSHCKKLYTNHDEYRGHYRVGLCLIVPPGDSIEQEQTSSSSEDDEQEEEGYDDDEEDD